MKKIITAGMAAVLLCFSQTGCGSGDAVGNKVVDQAANVVQAKNESVPAVKGKGVAPKNDTAQGQGMEEGGLSFADLSQYSFNFSSGAGAWGTALEINVDGSFTGSYHDINMGDTGAGYPNGTVYVCNFGGQFTQLKKVNEYTYSMKMARLEYENAAGGEEIIDGVKYVYSDAYGLEDGSEFLVYLPGAPVSELPNEFINWVQYNISGASELPSYSLYNVTPQYGFFGYSKEGLANTYDDSYTKYGGGYTQKYTGDFYQSDESGSSYISMYSSREGDEIGNIEIECDWLSSYKGTIYDYGKPDEYTVISTSGGPEVYLEFHYDGSTPYFKLKQEPPKTAINADEWMVIGIFYLTEPWQYH